MKTKDEMLDVTQQWYAEFGELRQKYQLFVVMRDNAAKMLRKRSKNFSPKGV